MKNNHILDEEHTLFHVYYIMVLGITFNRFAHILSNDGMHFPPQHNFTCVNAALDLSTAITCI